MVAKGIRQRNPRVGLLDAHQVHPLVKIQSWNFFKNSMLPDSTGPGDHNAVKFSYIRQVPEVLDAEQVERKNQSAITKNIGKSRRANFRANRHKCIASVPRKFHAFIQLCRCDICDY